MGDDQDGADEGQGEYGEELHRKLHHKPIDEEPAEHKGKRVPDAGAGIVADDKEDQQQRAHREHQPLQVGVTHERQQETEQEGVAVPVSGVCDGEDIRLVACGFEQGSGNIIGVV